MCQGIVKRGIFLAFIFVSMHTFTSQGVHSVLNFQVLEPRDNLDESVKESRYVSHSELDGALASFRQMFSSRLEDFTRKLEDASGNIEQIAVKTSKFDKEIEVIFGFVRSLDARVSSIESILGINDINGFNNIYSLLERNNIFNTRLDSLEKKHETLSVMNSRNQIHIADLKLQLNSALEQYEQRLRDQRLVSELDHCIANMPPEIASTPRPNDEKK
jgi:hypothetical protein